MASVVPKLKLGSQGLVVPAQGLGMGMSSNYGPPRPETDRIKLIHHAINSGVTFLDTSDIYGPYTNEILIGKALKEGGLRERVQIATKFGIQWVDGKPEVRGDPAYVRSACEASLKRLDIDCIDLYYAHRIDTRVPIEVTMGELKKLVEEGKVKYVGLSEASASTIRRAHAVHPITAIQNEWSLWSRDSEEDIVPTCRELGIGIVPYGPIGRGFLAAGPKLVENLTDGDFRKRLPRFQNAEHNKMIFERVNEMATRKGCTAAQLALAWVHHQGNDVVPIPGTTKIENFNQNIGALSVKLTPEEMAELESFASPDMVKGERHALQKTLGSFKNMILLSSPQDGYVPYHSARIEMCQAASGDYSKKGKVFLEMLNNCLDQIRAPSSEQRTFMRCDVNFDISLQGRNLNTIIGRAAHIEFLETDIFAKFIFWSFPEFFR